MKPLWTPCEKYIKKTHMFQFLNNIQNKYGLHYATYSDLHKWSIENPRIFWEETWKYCNVIASAPYSQVMGDPKMPGTQWFQCTLLNFS